MKLGEHKKWLVLLLLMGGVAAPLIVWGIISVPQNTGEQNPFSHLFSNLENRDSFSIHGNVELDATCAGAGGDGLSWETAYVLENFLIDGNNATVPNRLGKGLFIVDTTRYLVIRNISVKNAHETGDGIFLWECDHVNITGCGFFNNQKGVMIDSCRNVTIEGCKFWGNSWYDISLVGVYSSRVSGNEMLGNGLETNFHIGWGNVTIDPTNTVNGKSILYYEGQQNLQLAGISSAMVILFNCSDSIITNFTFSTKESGIHLANCTNISIQGNHMVDTGQFPLELTYSRNCCLSNNVVQNSSGLSLYHANNTTIRENTIDRGVSDGISLVHSDGCNITGNSITRCSAFAIDLVESGNAMITNNNFCSNNPGNISENSDINLANSTGGNTIYGNTEEDECASDGTNPPDVGVPGFP